MEPRPLQVATTPLGMVRRSWSRNYVAMRARSPEQLDHRLGYVSPIVHPAQLPLFVDYGITSPSAIARSSTATSPPSTWPRS